LSEIVSAEDKPGLTKDGAGGVRCRHGCWSSQRERKRREGRSKESRDGQTPVMVVLAWMMLLRIKSRRMKSFQNLGMNWNLNDRRLTRACDWLDFVCVPDGGTVNNKHKHNSWESSPTYR